MHDCVECGANAFVAGVLPVDGVGNDTIDACFACGQSCTDRDIDHCNRCGVLAPRPDGGLAVCEQCTAAWMAG